MERKWKIQLDIREEDEPCLVSHPGCEWERNQVEEGPGCRGRRSDKASSTADLISIVVVVWSRVPCRQVQIEIANL